MEYSGYGNKGDSAKSFANWQSDPEQQCWEAADGLVMSTRCTDDCKWFHACFECIKDLNLETDLPWSEGCLGVVDHDVTGTSERSFAQYHRVVVFHRLKGHMRGNGRSREQVDRDGGDLDPGRSLYTSLPMVSLASGEHTLHREKLYARLPFCHASIISSFMLLCSCGGSGIGGGQVAPGMAALT